MNQELKDETTDQGKKRVIQELGELSYISKDKNETKIICSIVNTVISNKLQIYKMFFKIYFY